VEGEIKSNWERVYGGYSLPKLIQTEVNSLQAHRDTKSKERLINLTRCWIRRRAQNIWRLKVTKMLLFSLLRYSDTNW
jgi:hypothetical protein